MKLLLMSCESTGVLEHNKSNMRITSKEAAENKLDRFLTTCSVCTSNARIKRQYTSCKRKYMDNAIVRHAEWQLHDGSIFLTTSKKHVAFQAGRSCPPVTYSESIIVLPRNSACFAAILGEHALLRGLSFCPWRSFHFWPRGVMNSLRGESLADRAAEPAASNFAALAMVVSRMSGLASSVPFCRPACKQ